MEQKCMTRKTSEKQLVPIFLNETWRSITQTGGWGRVARPHVRTPTWTSQVFQVLLDAPECVRALPQLVHLLVRQGHVDDAADAPAVQHAGQAEVHLSLDSVHTLWVRAEARVRSSKVKAWVALGWRFNAKKVLRSKGLKWAHLDHGGHWVDAVHVLD